MRKQDWESNNCYGEITLQRILPMRQGSEAVLCQADGAQAAVGRLPASAGRRGDFPDVQATTGHAHHSLRQFSQPLCQQVLTAAAAMEPAARESFLRMCLLFGDLHPDQMHQALHMLAELGVEGEVPLLRNGCLTVQLVVGEEDMPEMEE